MVVFGASQAWATCGSLVSQASAGSLLLSFVQGSVGAIVSGNSADGQMVYDAAQKKLKVCAGTNWGTLVPEGAAGTNISVPGVMKTTDEMATYRERLGFYHYGISGESTEFFSLRWLHLKTNQTMNTKMQVIEFVGYEYRTPRIIDARIGYYPYGPSDSIVGVNSNGTNPLNVYKSADGYVVLAINARPYHIGFVLNQYAANPTGMFAVEITDTKWTDSNTGAY